MNQPTTSIDVHDLHKNFGQIQALARVNLQVETGQIFGLLGPNGAGKTTLIRLLVGSTRPSSGRLSVLGLDPTRQKRALRRLIGYMPQSPALYEDLSARDNIHFFGRAHHPENLSKRVDEVIEFAQLTARARDPVYTFSGGMKQRVSLVVSTHQMDEALYCDRLAILHQGVVLADDSPRRLLSDSRATIKISCGDERIEHRVTNYPEHLPRVLQHYGLDPAISRIEVERESLETIVLRMIDDHETDQSALHSMGSEG